MPLSGRRPPRKTSETSLSITADNLSNAYELFGEIKRRVTSLYTSPERGRIVPELQDQGVTQYRELIVSPWRIIYRVSQKGVYTLSVLDVRRNVEDILLTRLVRSQQ
jgi:toxin ParE1/3/4